jgi:hypothetical protein
MEEGNGQRELFNFETKPKKRPFRLSGLLPRPDFEGKIALTLTLDKLVFISIGVIMALIIVFALGVEKGKSRSAAYRPAVGQVPQFKPAQAPLAAQKSFLSTAPAATEPRPAPVLKSPASQSKTEGAQDASRPYSIVAATFTKKDTALATAAFLKKEGFSPIVTYDGTYYRVYVGSYAQMQTAAAQRDLAKVRRLFKDAFIKLR